MPVSCGKGNLPACVPAVASLYRGYLSCVPSIFCFCRSPRKGFLPRRRKLRIVHFTASGKTHSLRCSSSPHKAMRLCGDPDNGGVFWRWHAPHSFGTSCPEVTSGQSVQKSVSLRCFPGRGISFRTVIRFSRCGSSMNYPKSTPKRQPVPYIRKVGNPPKKLPISTLSELW